MIRRVFLIVLDSCGVGQAPDAAEFSDQGADTMRTIAKSGRFEIPNLLRLGLGDIEGIDYLKKPGRRRAAVGKAAERSRGKDTTTGHWEIAGLVSESPMPTYPDGFPPEVISAFEEATGRKALCNKVYSGTQVILDYGQEHLRTGNPIVYTSADSVFQIAAHESVIPPEELYEICRKARALLTGKHAVGRVIARPFTGEYPDFERTSRRHDFSLTPPRPTLLDAVSSAGLQCLAVGKIHDIFAGRGITEYVYTSGNEDGMEKTSAWADRDFHGLCFVNLVDFDSKYGHRRDIDGYASALSVFDRWLGGFMKHLGEEDVLMITADHGCDPGYKGTDHTREYIPVIVYGKKIRPVKLGVRESFADLGATAAELLGVPLETSGKSFAKEILR